MNLVLFGYLLVGYIEAFNRCMRLERKGINIDKLTTGIIIMLYLSIWPLLCFIDIATEAVFHLIYREQVKSMKENEQHD